MQLRAAAATCSPVAAALALPLLLLGRAARLQATLRSPASLRERDW